jgi:phosphate transport system permease protein
VTSTRRARRARDVAFVAACTLAFAIAVAPLLAIVAHAVVVVATSPSFAPARGAAGLGRAMLGSLSVVAIAASIAIPIGVLAGAFCAESRRFGRAARMATDALGGLPPIVVGLVVYVAVVVPMRRHSVLAGALALAIIAIPIVARGTDTLLGLVPKTLGDVATSLGLPRWRVVAFALLPAVARGVVATASVAIGRALGETAPLLLTSFQSSDVPRGPLDATSTLPVAIWLQSASPEPADRARAWSAALVLLGMATALHLLAGALRRRAERTAP